MFPLQSLFWRHQQIPLNSSASSSTTTTTTSFCAPSTGTSSADRRASSATTFNCSIASSTGNECAVMIVRRQSEECTTTTTSVVTDRGNAADTSVRRSSRKWFGCCCSFRLAIVVLMPLLPIAVLLLCYLLLPSSVDRSEKPIAKDKPPILEDPLIRLPTDVLPIHYELHLKVYLPYRPAQLDFGTNNMTVDGHLRLLLLCRAPTDVLMMHAKALSIEHAKTAIWPDEMRQPGPRVIGCKELAGGNDLLELKLDKALLPGRNYVLEMDYKAKIGKAHEGGLYGGSYTSEDGEIRLLAATQMQPLDARRLLPCFDEPSFKADFSISVQHPEGTTVLSNAPLAHFRRVERGWSLSLFERTPKMATYLLALTVSDFKHKETSYKDVTIRVWVQPSKLAHTEHALEVTVRSLEYLEDYFGIPYPLKKLDIFGVPFLRVAAMENWGLIMSRQQNLVYTEGVQAKRERQFVTDVLAHEIAHMWFGDLVTMEWWDDLWLNEGFATIMGMKAADYAENSTSRTSQLFYEHTVKAFRFDQIAHQAHALSYKIGSVREVARRFDRITYLKAAAVLRMVERTQVGDQMFKLGLRSFLRLFAYRNARSEDLLRALSTTMETSDQRSRAALAIVNFSLGEFMDSWTYQTGFPLISLKPARNASLLIADQEQFFYLAPAVPNPSRWKVPLFFDTPTTNETLWLLENGPVNVPRGVLIDSNAHGYYRIQYDNDTYRALICTLLTNHTQIELATRARLLEDAFTLARAGRLPFSLVLRMGEYLPAERSYLPFLVFNNHVQLVLLLLRNHPKIEIFRQFVQQMLEPMYQRVFSTNVPPNDLSDTMREFAMIQLCHFDYAPCVNKSLTAFAQLKVLCQNRMLSDRNCNSTAIRLGTTDDFEFIRRKYFAEEYDSEKGRILSGLVSTRSIELVNSLINEFFVDKKAFEEDFYGFLLKFVKSPILNQIVEYMRHNFRVFANRIRHPSIMKVVLTYVTKWMQSERELEELDAFERENAVDLRDLRLLAYLKELRMEIGANIEFVGRGAVQIFDFLDKRRLGKRGSRTTADDVDECRGGVGTLIANYTHQRFFKHFDRLLRAGRFALMNTEMYTELAPQNLFLRLLLVNVGQELCTRKFLC
ncbi:hypothetical protein GPALN_006887 [Globodera pallida]|nr:hypothetical protein GPALN_006887 [Globodera pallida]